MTQEEFLEFLERYHREMKKSLAKMNDKIDECTDAVSNLTEKIPQWVFYYFYLKKFIVIIICDLSYD